MILKNCSLEVTKLMTERKPPYACLPFLFPKNITSSSFWNLLASEQHATAEGNLSELSENGVNHLSRCLSLLGLWRGRTPG